MNGLAKRIIPCLDVANGRTVKGIQFTGLRDIGDPVALALEYQAQGADELVFLDISASVDGRETIFELVERVAAGLMIPFTVGGGISTLDHVRRLLIGGADKVSINTAAVKRPQLLKEIGDEFGAQCCVLAIDARFNEAGTAWEVLTQGGRTQTGINAVEWAQEAVSLGAGEILLTSWDKDGTLSGFDLLLTRTISEAVSVPVIASGGGSGPESFAAVFTEGKADAALAATIFHDGQWTVANLKAAIVEHQQGQGIHLRQ